MLTDHLLTPPNDPQEIPLGKADFSWLTDSSYLKSDNGRASLVAQWLRICLPMQGTWVRALVQEDPTCSGAAEPMHHNYRACTLEPASHNY